MSLNKTEQKSRRTLAKTVAAELRSRAKSAGWKISRGWLFREDDGWFVDARPHAWVEELKSTLNLFSKPMSIDPVFWEIVDTPDNNKLPLSFRLFGAWTVSTPALSEVEVEERSLDVASLSDTIIHAAQRAFERSRVGRSLEGFVTKLREHHGGISTHPYLPAIVCTLALLDRREEARSACISARERRKSGGFQVGSRTFVDLALEWLTKTRLARH
jgi:hypothetical protein